MNTKHIIIFLIVAVVVFFIVRKARASKKAEPVYITGPGGTLTRGSTGDDVKQLQQKLNELIRENNRKNITMYCDLTPTGPTVTVGLLTVDGIYGNNTAAAMWSMFGTLEVAVEQIPGLTFTGNYGSVYHSVIGQQ